MSRYSIVRRRDVEAEETHDDVTTVVARTERRTESGERLIDGGEPTRGAKPPAATGKLPVGRPRVL